MTDDTQYANIREVLAHLIGNRLVTITQHDPEDYTLGRDSFVELMFEDGCTLRFFVLDGDKYKDGFPFSTENVHDKSDEFYHPSEENAAAHKWAIVVDYTLDGPVDHVIPCYGKLHEYDPTCWCNPSKEKREDDTEFYLHEEKEAE